MIFALHDGQQFEIPDQWWIEAGMGSFRPSSSAYACQPDADYLDCAITVVPIASIEPLRRHPNVILDFGGFRRHRLISVLSGFVANSPIVPVQLLRKSHGLLEVDPKYNYSVYDGYPRFYASIAAGFTAIPAMIEKWGLHGLDEDC